MKIISHRGNIVGPNPDRENHPDYINKAIYQGYDCELDAWMINDYLWLGHDKPQYKIGLTFLIKNSDKLWVHCKNIATFYNLSKYEELNCFMHDQDDVALTTKHFFWSYPRKTVNLTPLSVAVMPERVYCWENLHQCYGICTDYTEKYQKNFNV